MVSCFDSFYLRWQNEQTIEKTELTSWWFVWSCSWTWSWLSPCLRGSRGSRRLWTMTVWSRWCWSARTCRTTWRRTQLSSPESLGWSRFSSWTPASHWCSTHRFMASATLWDYWLNWDRAGPDPSKPCLCSQVRTRMVLNTISSRLLDQLLIRNTLWWVVVYGSSDYVTSTIILYLLDPSHLIYMWCSEGRVWCPHFVPSEPLPVRTAHISDYKESPETGVVFDIECPAGNVFSRVNISYTEGQQARAMLYKGPELLWGSVSGHGLFFHISQQNSWRSWATFTHVSTNITSF